MEGSIDQYDGFLHHISSLYVDRGLFALRYVSAADPDQWPIAIVLAPASDEEAIRLIAAPGVVPGQLSAPGACVVVLAKSAGVLRVGVRPRRPGGSVEAVIRLEPLDKSDHLGDHLAAPELAAPFEAGEDRDGFADNEWPYALAAPDFKLIAHIARQGDVEVGSGEWAAGPAEPAPIEGLEIAVAKASDIGLELQALAPGPRPQWSAWKKSGTFVGTRGRALPIVGLRLRLSGPASAGLILSVDALFLGSSMIHRRGKAVELVGSFGTDPLVGLRIALAPTSGPETSRRDDPAAAARPRVRIFRAAEQAARAKQNYQ